MSLRYLRTGGLPWSASAPTLHPVCSSAKLCLPAAATGPATVPAPGGDALGQEEDSAAPGPDPSDHAPGPVSDPFQDADALEELEERITTLAAHIHAATHRLLTLIAEFDRRRGWELGGHRSCAHWLSFRTGIDLGTAREKVRTARALAGLPRTSASMARGELSFSQARALTRVAKASNEDELLELAQGCTIAQLERTLRAYRRGSREEEVEWEQRRWESRTLSVFPDDDGMYAVRGRLPAEVGALLMRAVEAASDALFKEKEGPWVPESERERAAAQLRADALGLLAERALAAGFGERGGEGGESGGGESGAPHASGCEAACECGGEPEAGSGGSSGRGCECGCDSDAGSGLDACCAPGERDGEPAGTGTSRTSVSRLPVPISGTRPERYQVILHVDPQTLMAGGEPGRSELEDGTRLSCETSRRLTCDAAVVRIRYDTDGSVLDVGRKRRTIPPALRRALEVRDRGCCFPGCGCRFTAVHHIRHWADQGETKLSNCALLCAHHHRLVHESGWKMDWWGEGRPVFFSPRGRIFYGGRREPPKLCEDPVEALVEENERGGVQPDMWTAGAEWKQEADIPDEVFLPALEAMGEARRLSSWVRRGAEFLAEARR